MVSGKEMHLKVKELLGGKTETSMQANEAISFSIVKAKSYSRRTQVINHRHTTMTPGSMGRNMVRESNSSQTAKFMKVSSSMKPEMD